MQSQIDDLQQEVHTLRAELGKDWLTETRAKEIADLVGDVLADADTRASLLGEGPTAGHDGTGFFIGSPDGNALLRIAGRVQPRHVYNHQDNSPNIDVTGDGVPDPGTGDDNVSGFEIRRMKLDFHGHVLDPSWFYYIQIAGGNAGAAITLDDAYIEKKLGNGWRVRGGQYKPPFMHEDLVSSRFQLAAERSVVNEIFSQRNRAIGAELAYYGDRFLVRAMLNDGFGNVNRPALSYDTEFAATARAEFLLEGDWGDADHTRRTAPWSQFKGFTSWSDGPRGALLGAAVHYEKQESGTSAPNGVDNEQSTLSFTGDLTLHLGGANLFVAGVYRRLDNGFSADQYGLVVQGGLFVVPDELEVFARWEYGDLDMGVSNLNLLTVGVNRYFAGHALKFTFDAGYAFDPVAPGFAASRTTGWRADSPGERGQIVLRSQFQLLF
ncbi:MAG: hypothetical protein GY715_16875 [Planctomycetes bacterium]|nr:hypothetical protein [Planctomycetota bacterium]